MGLEALVKDRVSGLLERVETSLVEHATAARFSFAGVLMLPTLLDAQILTHGLIYLEPFILFASWNLFLAKLISDDAYKRLVQIRDLRRLGLTGKETLQIPRTVYNAKSGLAKAWDWMFEHPRAAACLTAGAFNLGCQRLVVPPGDEFIAFAQMWLGIPGVALAAYNTFSGRLLCSSNFRNYPHLLKGFVYSKLNQSQRYKRILHGLTERDRTNAIWHFELAEREFSDKNVEKGFEAALKGLQVARTYQLYFNVKKETAYIRESIFTALNPHRGIKDDFTTEYVVAYYLARIGRKDLAIQRAARFTQTNSQISISHILYFSRFLWEMGMHKEAMQALKPIFEPGSEFHPIYNVFGGSKPVVTIEDIAGRDWVFKGGYKTEEQIRAEIEAIKKLELRAETARARYKRSESLGVPTQSGVITLDRPNERLGQYILFMTRLPGRTASEIQSKRDLTDEELERIAFWTAYIALSNPAAEDRRLIKHRRISFPSIRPDSRHMSAEKNFERRVKEAIITEGLAARMMQNPILFEPWARLPKYDAMDPHGGNTLPSEEGSHKGAVGRVDYEGKTFFPLAFAPAGLYTSPVGLSRRQIKLYASYFINAARQISSNNTKVMQGLTPEHLTLAGIVKNLNYYLAASRQPGKDRDFMTQCASSAYVACLELSEYPEYAGRQLEISNLLSTIAACQRTV